MAVKKEFVIPCVWQVAGEMRIVATSLKEAMEIAENDESLPTDNEYLEGSFQVDHESDRLGIVLEENGIKVSEGKAQCPVCEDFHSYDEWVQATAKAEQCEIHEIGHLSVYIEASDDHSYVCPNCTEVSSAKSIKKEN